MRIKKYDKQQFIALRIDEAKLLKRMLDDYSYVCENCCGHDTDSKEINEFTNQLDEAILKAESM